jgi:hypothetical protein
LTPIAAFCLDRRSNRSSGMNSQVRSHAHLSKMSRIKLLRAGQAERDRAQRSVTSKPWLFSRSPRNCQTTPTQEVDHPVHDILLRLSRCLPGRSPQLPGWARGRNLRPPFRDPVRAIGSLAPRGAEIQHCFLAWAAALTGVSADVIAFYTKIPEP